MAKPPSRETFACPTPERLAAVVLAHDAAVIDKAIVGRNPHVYVRGYVIDVPKQKAAELRKALKATNRLRADIVRQAAKERYALRPPRLEENGEVA